MQKKHSLLRRNCTRKEYALARLRIATSRLMLAESETETTLATYWVNAWASVIGDAHFPDVPHRVLRPRARRQSARGPRD